MAAYTITTHRQTWTGPGRMTLTRENEQTVTVADRTALIRELEARGVPGRMQHAETGQDFFGGYVTEWSPVAEQTVIESARNAIPAREAIPGTVLRLEGPIAGPLGGVETVIQRAVVVRWEGAGQGVAQLVVRNARGALQYAGLFGPDHLFKLWP